MPDLGTPAMRRWFRNLPPDVSAVLTDDLGVCPEEAVRSLVDRLTAAPIEQAAEIIRQHDRVVADMGRARRVRLLAWLSKRITDPSHILAYEAIFDEEGGQGDGSSRPVSARLLYEDVALLVEHCVAPRMSRHALDPAALEVVTRSAQLAVMKSGFSGGLS
ncbi:hypothetical protein ACVIGB_000053 [Bradyrhizobium sp. USDA 4341]